jgi:glycosyltransferase involved in cell wall biosynthesis
MPSIAVILPAYNEELTIADTIEAFHRELPNARIIVVNNNSTDNSAAIAYNTLKRLNADGDVINEYRQGKGNAVRRAFKDIDADIYVLSDADFTYPANRVHDLIKPISEKQADMAVGDRQSGGHYKNENKRNFHTFGNDLVKVLVNKLFRSNLRDIMSGYRAYSRLFVKNYPVMVEGFQIETDMTLHALDKRFRIVEIPVEYKDRPSGSFSKLDTFADGAKVLFTIAQILRYYRPMMFFGGLSVLFGVLGIVASVPVFQDWIQFRYIYHLPLAVLAVALELVSVMSISAGLILDTIAHQNKMDFERHLLDS